jgi:hypothetical protein
MGQIAETMLDGTMCEGCGEYLGSDNGFPTYCAACANEKEIMYSGVGKNEKVGCPHCKKRVKKTGLTDHLRDVHPDTPVSPEDSK